MTPNRAKEILSKAFYTSSDINDQSWIDQIMDSGERDQVRAVCFQMPVGKTMMDALVQIANRPQ